MAIKIRRGTNAYFDPTKLVQGELGVVTDTGELYFCFSAGNTKKLQTEEDLLAVLGSSATAYSALLQCITDLENNPSELTNILNNILTLQGSIGDLTQLETTSNTDLVGAINELEENKASKSIDGNARGTNATDFQFVRTSDDQVAGTSNSFIAGGRNNKIQNYAKRDLKALDGYAEGYGNRVYDWYGHGEGSTCIVDGKISHAEGNTTICTQNDSHSEGNMTCAGRKYFDEVTYGSEDAGDSLGVLNYVNIPVAEGDVTSYFPNILTDNVTTRYGTGAQIDTKGNIYPSGMTPAIWTGDTLTTPNSLAWAMHSICVIRGSAEVDIEFADIAKATYSAVTGTKVYYYGDAPFGVIKAIYSSYAPTVLVGGIAGGNGGHAEGLKTSTYGIAAHAEGAWTRAWNSYTSAGGYGSRAYGLYASASNYYTEAIGDGSTAIGSRTKARGAYSVAEGGLTETDGTYSHASGKESLALRGYQESYSAGKNTVVGDNQTTRINYNHNCSGVGWFIIKILTECEDGKAYNFETMVLGRQTGGAAGTIGDTFAYKVVGCAVLSSAGVFSAIGTPTCTLIGRSSTMSGDGLTTGTRVNWSSLFTSKGIHLRMDGIADTIFSVTSYNIIQEMGL
jgi:hypothetical protein